jgi:nitronate monooxygenase
VLQLGASRLTEYYVELSIGASADTPAVNRASFDETIYEVVEAHRVEVVSFHFGLPTPALLRRIQAVGCKILGCATTVDEACWLEGQGCDAIITQDYEAGGHRGMFLTNGILT